MGKRAFVTYLKSVYLQKDKKVFDLSRFSAEQFAAYAASLGLPVTPPFASQATRRMCQRRIWWILIRKR